MMFELSFQGINIVVDIWNEVGKGKLYLICRGGTLGSHLFQSLASYTGSTDPF